MHKNLIKIKSRYENVRNSHDVQSILPENQNYQQTMVIMTENTSRF